MRSARFVTSVAVFVLLWGMVAALLRSANLPAPWAVAAFIADDLRHGDMLYELAVTLGRATASFLIAMLGGAARSASCSAAPGGRTRCSCPGCWC